MLFNVIFPDEKMLQQHLNAPLLNERLEYLEKVVGSDCCKSHLQRNAGFLLFVVEYLHLNKNGPPITTAQLAQLSSAWLQAKLSSDRYWNKRTCYRIHSCFIKTAKQWLEHMGLLDQALVESWEYFSQFFKNKSVVLLALCSSPMLKERMGYIASRMPRQKMRTGETRRLLDAVKILETLRAKDTPVNGQFPEEIIMRRAKEHCAGKSYNDFRSRQTVILTLNFLEYLGLVYHPEKHLRYLEYLDEYSEWELTSKGLTNYTVAATREELLVFLRFLQDSAIEFKAISTRDVDHYVETRGKGLSRWTIHHIVCNVKGFLRYAEAREWINGKISDKLHGPIIYHYEGLPLAPTRETMLEIVKPKANPTPEDIRDRAVLLMFVTYGIRKKELVEMRLGDIHWDEDLIVFRRAKSGRQQVFPLDAEVGNAVLKYLLEVRPRNTGLDYLFLSKKAPYKKICDAALIVTKALKSTGKKLTHYGPHALRHGVATYMVNAGSSIKNVSDMLGHRMLETTGIYAKVNLLNLRKVSDIDWEGLL
jgi:integrase/recombinase XerD